MVTWVLIKSAMNTNGCRNDDVWVVFESWKIKKSGKEGGKKNDVK